MRILHIITAIVVLSHLLGLVSAQERVEVAAPPGWAKMVGVEDFASNRDDQFKEGVAFLLSDRQVKKNDDGYEYFIRTVYKVVNRSGLEYAAKIDPSFDPSDTTLNYNFVRIIRDGEVIDKLTDAEIIQLRQEEMLDNGLIDGDITALIQLKDVRVGDTIDLAYSGEVVTELWPNEFFDDIWVEWSVPLAKLHYSLTTPESMKINVKSLKTDAYPTIRYHGDEKTYELTVLDADPAPIEANVPANWISFGFVSFSTMDAWSDLIEWGEPVYTFDTPLPPKFRATLDEIAAAHPSPKDRTVHALRLIQSDIRYLGFEDGLGSHKPRSPATTLERGYGDCKDKSVLLTAALNYLGISARPALANMFEGETVEKRLPSVNAFNHVIVGAQIDGRSYWLDPTMTHQGGDLDTLVQAYYGYVLPISKTDRGLVRIERDPPTSPYLEVLETYEFPETGEAGMLLNVEYTYRDYQADGRRADIEDAGREDWARNILDYYSAVYQGIEQTGPVDIDDDFDANVLRFKAIYQKEHDAYKALNFDTDLPIYAASIDGMIPRSVETDRAAPLGLPYPSKRRHVIRISTPGRRLAPLDDERVSAGGVIYERRFHPKAEALEIEYLLNVSERTAHGDDIFAVTKLAEKISMDSELSLDLTQALPSLAASEGFGASVSPETEAAIIRASQAYMQGDYRDALAQLEDLLDLHPEKDRFHGFLQMLRASALYKLRRYRSARIAYGGAFDLYEPSSTQEYYNYVGLLTSAKKDKEAAAIIVRLVQNHPDSLAELEADQLSEFFGSLSKNGFDDARETTILAIANAANTEQPDNLNSFRWMLSEALEIHARRNEIVEAEQYLPYLSNPRRIAKILSNRQMKGIWPALETRVGADLSKAIEENVEISRDALEQAPEDFQKLTDYINALRIAGRQDEIAELGENILRDWDQIEKVGEDAYWFVSEYAYALSESGDEEAALELMDRLIAIGLDKHRDLISMAINRAQMLMHAQHYEDALEAVGEIEALRRNPASDYGWMWIYDAKTCSQHQLGREEDAATTFQDDVLPIAASNPSAHTKTLLCLGEFDAAAELMIQRLGEDKSRETAIFSFVDVDKPDSTPPFLEQLQQRAAMMRARPDVDQAFSTVARKISMDGASAYWGEF